MKVSTLVLAACLLTTSLQAAPELIFGISEPAIACECRCGYYHVYTGTIFMIRNVHHYKLLSYPDRWWSPFCLVTCNLSSSHTLHVEAKRTGKVALSVIHTPETHVTYYLHIINKQSVELPSSYDTSDFVPYKMHTL